jgi:flagellar biosynthetic protein FlhB
MAGEKTEKPTDKKREDARKKGQVARSHELNGAAVLLAALLALSAFGPKLFVSLEEVTVALLHLVANPQVVTSAGLGSLMGGISQHVGLAVLPIIMTCCLAGVAINVVQIGVKPMPGVLKPQFGKLNPLKGFKNVFFSPNSLVEAAKGIAKVVFVGGVVSLALFPKIDELSALVGMSAADLLVTLATEAMGIAQKAALAYLAIAFADYLWQRKRHTKSLMMDKQELRDEHKGQDLPQEVKGQLRRRAMDAQRKRMMDDVPTADVVVTNPTHFSVALRYDGANLAPVVVAKGADLVAFKIRETARAAGVAVVPDPPLARSLYATVEVGQMIPEELYEAVAGLLAYVYKVAGRRAAAAGAIA